MKACDELLICCQPQVPAIAGTLQTFRASDRLKIPVFGVVLTRVTGKRFEIPASDIKRTLGWPTMAIIPEDDMVSESVTRGVPVVIHAPNSAAAVEYRKLAQAVLTHLRARKRVISVRKVKVPLARPAEKPKIRKAPEVPKEEPVEKLKPQIEVPSELTTTDILDRLDPASLVERKAFRDLLAHASVLKSFTLEKLVKKSRYPERMVATFCDRMAAKGFASKQDGSYNLKVRVL